MITDSVIQYIDQNLLTEAFEEFTGNCGRYNNCLFGPRKHNNCVSTCLTPKLRHMSIKTAASIWEQRLIKVLGAIENKRPSDPAHFKLAHTFKIGHSQIDYEHGQIVLIYNKIVDAFFVEDIIACEILLKEFKNEVEKHFRNEDMIMENLNYIDPDHDRLHTDLSIALANLPDKFETIAKLRQTIELLMHKFLLLILRHDFKFAEFLKEIDYKE